VSLDFKRNNFAKVNSTTYYSLVFHLYVIFSGFIHQKSFKIGLLVNWVTRTRNLGLWSFI